MPVNKGASQGEFKSFSKGNILAAYGPSASVTYLLFSQRKCGILSVGYQKGGAMKEKTDVLQGTLGLMALKTLEVLGPLHGYGIARRIEQISGDLLAVNQGTLYPVLLRREQEGAISSEWGASENNRRARFYRLTLIQCSCDRKGRNHDTQPLESQSLEI